ncbi:AraC family transcriptional regulator [uncultured Chitinophaga sp.]|uniref:helix-turn-helix domain-containing protein n=1 Tax=uncultured Chitinophaga sp. TaxID=339340 RepID=UPI0025F9D4F0|nr:helix-turn-helix transcriptional regulator [uncultured Chitinophaga sp.]
MHSNIIFSAGRPPVLQANRNTCLFSKQFSLYDLAGSAGESFWEDDAPKRLEHFEILWCKSASGWIQVDSQVCEVKPQQIFLLAPGQLRRFRLAPGATGHYLSFSPDFLYVSSHLKEIASILEQNNLNMQLLTLRADYDIQRELEEVISKMQREYQNNLWMRDEILTGLLSLLMIYLSRRLEAVKPAPVVTREGELTIRFRLMLKKEFLRKKKVAEYASSLMVTPNYLNTSIRKVTGFTASYHIQQQIINEAKRQLLSSRGSMKEIAFHLGFDNIAHFSKYFKTKTGMNFTRFRHELERGD